MDFIWNICEFIAYGFEIAGVAIAVYFAYDTKREIDELKKEETL